MLIDQIEREIKLSPLAEFSNEKTHDQWTDEILLSGGIFAKKMRLQKGQTVITHTHKYDHISILAGGSASVVVENHTRVMGPGEMLEVKAGEKHAITALDDIIWYCIHNEEVALCHGQ